MKILFILLIPIVMVSSSFGSDLDKAMTKAASQLVGSDEWYEALVPYVERSSTNELGRLTAKGFQAVRDEFEEIKAELLKGDPALDLTTELKLATDYLKSEEIRELPKFHSRLSRICNIVGRLEVHGKLKDTRLMFRCDHLEFLILHHGIRPYLPKEKR